MLTYRSIPNDSIFRTNACRNEPTSLKKKSQKKQIIFGLLSVIVAIIGILSFGPTSEASKKDQIILVQQGDTVWSIAMKVAYPTQDIRDVVLDIEKRNALSGPLLQPGMRLKVSRP